MSELTNKTALQLNSIFLNKEASAEQITEAFLQRIDQYDKEINAFISVKEIIKLANEKFGEQIEPAENRVVQFMKQMHSNRLIMLFEKTSK